MAPKVKRQRRRMCTIEIGVPGQPGYRKYRIPYSHGKERIELDRVNDDTMEGEPGFMAACANAVCGYREKQKFPHAVHIIQFEPHRAVIVDRIKKKDGTPLHAMMYKHNQYNFIMKYDKPGLSKGDLIAAGEGEDKVILRPLSKSEKNRVRPNDGRGPHTSKKPPTRYILRGPHARLTAAGLLDLPKKKK